MFLMLLVKENLEKKHFKQGRGLEVKRNYLISFFLDFRNVFFSQCDFKMFVDSNLSTSNFIIFTEWLTIIFWNKNASGFLLLFQSVFTDSICTQQECPLTTSLIRTSQQYSLCGLVNHSAPESSPLCCCSWTCHHIVATLIDIPGKKLPGRLQLSSGQLFFLVQYAEPNLLENDQP